MRIIDRLEEKRCSLHLSAAKFLKTNNVTWDPSTYSRVLNGKASFPQTWIADAARILGISEQQLLVERSQEENMRQERLYSAEELERFAEIVSRVGHPLSLRTLQSIDEEGAAAKG